jgi:cytochrome c peroxidase
MHDGSFQSLEQVLAHYQKGAAKNPLQDARITSFILSPTEKKQLLAFFDALIDTSYLKRDKF